MSEGIWVAIITVGGGLLTAIASGIAVGLVRVVSLVLQQSQSTITALKDERDYWRGLAEQCRDATDGEGRG